MLASGDDDVVGLGHTGSRDDQVELAGERAGVEGCWQQLDPERVRQILLGVIDVIIGDHHVVATSLEGADRRLSGDRKAVDEHSHGQPDLPGEVGDEDRQRRSDTDRRDQPEPDDDGGLRPAAEFEMMVDRRHAEQPSGPAGGLEHTHLNGDRAGLDHIDAADQDQQEVRVECQCQERER